MVRTCASEAASSSAACQQPRRAPLQEAQDPESELEVMESDDAARDRPVLGEPIKEASTSTDEEDAELVYGHTCFRRDKVRCRYFRYYHGRRIIVEMGSTIKEFNKCALRVRAMLDAQGWTYVVEDHCPTVEAIVWELYMNLHQRRGDSFRTWLRGTVIELTHTFISAINRAPCVCDPTYPYSVDHLPARAVLVACFVEGCPHLELDREGSF
jgi:hypothetical protein